MKRNFLLRNTTVFFLILTMTCISYSYAEVEGVVKDGFSFGGFKYTVTLDLE